MIGNSPTLVQGQRYVSVVADLPPALGGRIRSWQLNQGVSPTAAHGHVTVFVGAEPQCNAAAWPGLQQDAAALGPVQISLGAPSTFLPISPVSFLTIRQGASHLARLHQLCQSYLGPSATPFDYVPHVTLGHNLSSAALEQSLEDFKELPAELASFTVERLRVSCFDGQRWNFLRMLELV